MPTKQLRCIPSIKEGGQGFRVNLRLRSGSYDSCIHFSVVCCSSSLKALLSENSEKEDFSESTIEDIKGWCKKVIVEKINYFQVTYCQNMKIVTVILRVYN